jgi:hypothetical protein
MLEMAIVVKDLVIKVVLAIVVDVLVIRVAMDLVGLVGLTTTNSLVITGFEDGRISFSLQLKSKERARRS